MLGRASAQAVSQRPLTAKARFRSPLSPSEICGGQSGMGQVCGGQNGTGTGLWWTEWDWDRFVVDRVGLGQVSLQARRVPLSV
jgi:hypothetical protein